MPAKPFKVGSLASNQIVLGGAGVEPIHCLIERDAGQAWRIVDLGTLAGVRLNGARLDVEALLSDGDVLELGGARLTVRLAAAETLAATGSDGTVPLPRTPRTSARLLFARQQRHQGRLLEVVAFWGDTVLNVDHFHPSLKGFGVVTIGDPTKAHFLSGGEEFFAESVLADVGEDRSVLRLTAGMQARVRKDGEVKKVTGRSRRLTLGPSDYALIEHGPVRYFLHYADQPNVELPKLTSADRFLIALGWAATALYLALVALALTTKPEPIKTAPAYDEIPWETTYVDVTPPPKAPVKPPVKVRDHQDPAAPKTVQVKPPKVKPTTPVAEPKPTPPKTVAAHHTTTSVKEVLHQQPSATLAPSAAAAPAQQSGAPGKTGAPGGDKRPALTVGNTGGPGQRQAQSGPLKGRQTFNNPGVEGGQKAAPSLPNLKQLSVGLGPVLNQAGGLHTDFKPAGGGAGMKAGSASRDRGLGTVGSGNSLALPGSSGKLGSWGSGPGGLIGSGGPGQGGLASRGPGGLGRPGALPGGPGGHHAADVQIAPPQDPVTQQSLSYEEILAVIRQHLNEIRHCYEQLLQRAPNSMGEMKVGFSINAAGSVTTVNVLSTTVDDTMMRACVAGKIQRWHFPLPRGTAPVQVTYPFIFKPL